MVWGMGYVEIIYYVVWVWGTTQGPSGTPQMPTRDAQRSLQGPSAGSPAAPVAPLPPHRPPGCFVLHIFVFFSWWEYGEKHNHTNVTLA